MDIVYLHIHRWMAEPFVWGGSERVGASDCMLVLADYLVDLGYPDIGAKWRGRYDSALSAQRVAGFLTDPVRPLAEGCASIGLRRTEAPKRGDIGIVRFLDVDGPKVAGSIFLGRNWAVKGERKVVVGQVADVLASWSVANA